MLTFAVQWIPAAMLLAVGGVAILLALYLAVLSSASLFYKPREDATLPTHRLVVLIPAHNEAQLIGRCLASLQRQTYPADLYRLVVVADNCTDETTTRAKQSGAEVLERNEAWLPGKGRALRWAIDQVLARPNPPDAFVVVDADSVADAKMLTALAGELRAGHQVVQGAYLALPENQITRPSLGALALLLVNYVRLAGRAVLGMPASLVGNGMLLSDELMRSLPWNAFSPAEDLEYTVTLRRAGVRPRFAGAARVSAPLAAVGSAARSQRRRWEGGRFHVIAHSLGPVLLQALRRGDWRLLDEALELLVPPLSLLVLILAAGSALAAGLVLLLRLPAWIMIPWPAAALAVVLYLALGFVAVRAPISTYLALLGAPIHVLRKIALYAGLLRQFDAQSWVRTPRPGEQSTPRRMKVAGVPVDRLTMSEAIDRLAEPAAGNRPRQVCTINLDFLVRARFDQGIRSIFENSDLNLADGFPVLWLARLQGDRLPQRVAGADLVPRLMAAAAERGASVYLLGGEGGVARDAARQLSATVPGLRIAGWFEPPRAPIDTMDNCAIIRDINSSGADLLLVALGHPKQDRWIAAHRDELRVSVAIGVGCCLDLIAGRVRRAPAWMQRAGLEWLFRAMQEPRRLAGRYAVDFGALGLFILPALWHRISRAT